jgi:hypothetical protein
MSEDATSAPLPVVACEIVPQFTFAGFNTPPQVATVQNDTGVWIAAVAVPWALFEDEGFRRECRHRLNEMLVDWLLMSTPGQARPDIYDAIAAELTHRLQPEVDA